ncbi:MAG TPA: AtpZ/AtpI family protein [Pyrinomonadaceae bacterium]|nr:AtpZ/AtpI family protein [Pyrinomonadaceae bacterium]
MSQDWQDPYGEDAEPQKAVSAPEPAATVETESNFAREPGNSLSLFDPEPAKDDEPFILESFTPASADENARRFGLGWSAGIAFSGAIAFMVFLGWLVDLLIGSAPWGIVLGVILGAAIGFFQLFRITSRIFPNNSAPKVNPLLSSRNRQD